MLKLFFKYFLILIAIVPFLIITIILALVVRNYKPKSSSEARIVFGPSPIINNKYWSNSLKESGFRSQTFMTNYSATINKKEDFDEYLIDQYPLIPLPIKRMLSFWRSLLSFDVFMLSYEGWLLGKTVLWRLEPFFLFLAGKRVVIFPFGADVHVYRNIRSIEMLHGLLMSYPECSKLQARVEKHVHLWTKKSNCVAPAILGMDGIGRWDILRPSMLCIDLREWKVSQRQSSADGKNDTVYIAHAPNHTGFKGTEFVVDAVEKLKEEGLKVELILLQGIQNDEVRRVLNEDVDILVEQLICSGHGLNAVEGMASGLPVITNLEDKNYTTIFRRWSFMNECPLVSANPEVLLDQLRKLVINPELRQSLGGASRAYVEKYFSYEASVYMFENILKYVYGEKESLINLYHPLLGEYNKMSPTIEPPLVNNRIINNDIT